MRPSSTESGPVLIVGAGPAGLMLAAVLARFGVPFRLIEKNEGPAGWSRAVVVHARSLEILGQLGVEEAFERAGQRVYAASIHAGERRLASFSFDELESSYPYVLTIPQRETERILAASIEEDGAEIEWSTELIDLAPEEEQATAWIRRPDGRREVVRCSWVIGCDGAGSLVRQLSHLSGPSSGIRQRFWLADLPVRSGADSDTLLTAFDDKGAVGLIPLPDHVYRFIAAVDPDDDRKPDLEVLRALAARRGLFHLEFGSPKWIGTFTIRPALARGLRNDRVFIAGDAAHVFTPMGGQGMNLGIQEAFNLGWKLALVQKGLLRSHVLDSYEAERFPIVQALGRDWGRALRVATLRHPVARTLRDYVAEYLSSLEVVQQRMVRNLAMVDFDYRGSPIVRDCPQRVVDGAETARTKSPAPASDFQRGPRAGDPAPDAMVRMAGHESEIRMRSVLLGLRHTLLLFTGNNASDGVLRDVDALRASLAERYDGVMKIYTIGRGGSGRARDAHLEDAEGLATIRYGGDEPCCYLVRPDGYIGFRVQPMDGFEITDYLGTVFHL